MVLLKSSLAFWCALRPYLLESQSSTFFHLLMSHTPSIPEGSGGGTENALPHTLLIPEGSRGGAEKCKAECKCRKGEELWNGLRELFQIPERQNAVHFSGASFWEAECQLEEGQNAVHFSLLIFHAMRRYGIAIAPERQPEWHCYCNP